MLNFKEYYVENYDFLNADNIGKAQSGLTIELPAANKLSGIMPSITIKSKIRFIEKTKNPISIILVNGTRLFLSLDEFKRISGDNPEIGKNLSVIMQRLEGDTSKTPSKINAIVCH